MLAETRTMAVTDTHHPERLLATSVALMIH